MSASYNFPRKDILIFLIDFAQNERNDNIEYLLKNYDLKLCSWSKNHSKYLLYEMN